jgi:hypothetical protein
MFRAKEGFEPSDESFSARARPVMADRYPSIASAHVYGLSRTRPGAQDNTMKGGYDLGEIFGGLIQNSDIEGVRMYRDSIVWWLAIVGALIAYLVSAGKPPTVWDYSQWLQFAAAVVATVSGKLANSPLKGKDA